MASDQTPIRPTKSVVVRALRDILRPVINGTVVLDLFAGTARVGIELLEEGAETVVGVDKRDSPEDLPGDYEWVRGDVENYLRSAPERSYDVIFMDPPYDSGLPSDLLPVIVNENLLREHGIIAIETDLETELPEAVDSEFFLMRRRKYGGTRLWIYQSDRNQPGYRD